MNATPPSWCSTTACKYRGRRRPTRVQARSRCARGLSGRGRGCLRSKALHADYGGKSVLHWVSTCKCGSRRAATALIDARGAGKAATMRCFSRPDRAPLRRTRSCSRAVRSRMRLASERAELAAGIALEARRDGTCSRRCRARERRSGARSGGCGRGAILRRRRRSWPCVRAVSAAARTRREAGRRVIRAASSRCWRSAAR